MELKTCKTCGESKSSDEFIGHGYRVKGVAKNCKVCRKIAADKHQAWRSKSPANREKSREAERKWRRENPDLCNAKKRARRAGLYGYQEVIRWKYKMTPEQYRELLAKHNGKCAICDSKSTGRKTDRRLSIDHCHVTGVVRGLLCHKCNLAIGAMEDDVTRVFQAASYLMKFKPIGTIS